MPWSYQHGETARDHAKIHSVRNAGYAGLVNMSPERAEDYGMHEGEDGDHFDEDLWDDSSPEPTHEENAHYEEHGEYPDEYDERHAQAYEEAQQKKKDEDRPDYEDDELMDFIGNHGNNRHLWDTHASYGPVDIKNQPVYATQSHVSQNHIDKYLRAPHAQVHQPSYSGEYPADEAPMMVTHNGRLHVTDGHHRVAAALQRGDSHIDAYHYNADKHGFPHDDEDEDWD
jgi:hypothetical protein